MVFKKMNVKQKPPTLLRGDKTMLIAFVLSIVIHLGIIYTIPAVELFAERPGGGSDLIEVDFVEEEGEDVAAMVSSNNDQFLAASPQQTEPAVPNPPPQVDPDVPASVATAQDIETDVPYALLDDPQEMQKLLKASGGQSQLEPPSLASTMPADSSPGFKKRTLTLAQDLPTMSPEEPIASSGKTKRLVGFDKESASDQNRFGIFAGESVAPPEMKDKESVQEALLKQSARAETTAPKEQDLAAKTLDLSTQIEGPVRGRRVVYQPSPPKVDNIENEVELRFKFWVLPDGTIGEVVPLKRGDSRLERIAIDYLKRWQFQPLASGVPQQQAWGTIPIKFTLQ